MTDFELPPDSAFDLRVRAEMALAFDPGQPPAHLFRHTPLLSRRGFQRSLAALLLAATGAGTVFAMRPPALVREAIEHEYYERTLRGSFMPTRQLLMHLGLNQQQPVPGYPQLMRPCDIDGRLAYHLTTFIEKGGMVTVFAFDQPVALKAGSGWWNDMYWQVIDSRQGRPLVLVAQKKKALAVANNHLGKPDGQAAKLRDPAESPVFQ
ncbi:FIG00537944: hypothetical protein [Polaromonas sp. CG9_12]|uniref:hypothetical protein n=1 Tax=Polaromonas sp. CG_9.11 TaxID=2787730 RepID=UPI0004DDCA3C|nr:hypothetical protein [Polaromonas sp. CG_9.11]MBG6075446.1 hypothetical protein [Polaromonas sp. CG_9.11]CDS54251.1 FIG00537944: hypothetical protein [Polaromonas sp. CG9_12]